MGMHMHVMYKGISIQLCTPTYNCGCRVEQPATQPCTLNNRENQQNTPQEGLMAQKMHAKINVVFLQYYRKY
jgi:hypothetical protein